MKHSLKPIVGNNYAYLSLDSKLESIRYKINEYLFDSLHIDVKFLRYPFMEKVGKYDIFFNSSDWEHV